MLLLWLAIPLAASPVVSRSAPAGVARLLTGALALAILWQGTGTLNPADLAALGSASPDVARFIALSAGIGIAALVVAPRDSVVAMVPAIPLAIGLLTSLVPAALLVAAVGTAIALLPRGVAAIVTARHSHAVDREGVVSIAPRSLVVPLLAAVVIGAQGPFIISAAAASVVAWWSWQARDAYLAARWGVVRPLAVTLLLGVATWLVLTVAGDMLVFVRGAGQSVPASPAMERLVAALVLGAALALVMPSARTGVARAAMLAPAAVLLAWTASRVAPEGTRHWAPLVGGIVVVAAAVGVLRRLPLDALAAVAVLGAVIPARGWPFAALLLALYPALVRTGGAITWPYGETATGAARLLASSAAIALAVVLRSVLADEVVWALVLAMICITAACVCAYESRDAP